MGRRYDGRIDCRPQKKRRIGEYHRKTCGKTVKVQTSAIVALSSETETEKLSKLEKLYARLVKFGTEDAAVECRRLLKRAWDEQDLKS
jgi:hypothetical protein